MPPSCRRPSLTHCVLTGLAAQRSVPAQSVEFSADGTRFAAVYADRIAIHDGASEAEVLPRPCGLHHRLPRRLSCMTIAPSCCGTDKAHCDARLVKHIGGARQLPADNGNKREETSPHCHALRIRNVLITLACPRATDIC